jgi:hypothetical protein
MLKEQVEPSTENRKTPCPLTIRLGHVSGCKRMDLGDWIMLIYCKERNYMILSLGY